MSEGGPAAAWDAWETQEESEAPRWLDAPHAVPAQGQSAGALLRQIREAAGVGDVALLASVMKVAPRKLEALEGDRLDELPDLTFARGLASAICRVFGADPAPVLERMPVAKHDLNVPDAALNQRLHHWSEGATPGLARWFKLPLLLAAALALLAAAALWLLPTLPVELGAPFSEAARPAADRMTHENVTSAPAPLPAPAASAPASAAALAPASASVPASASAPVPAPASAPMPAGVPLARPASAPAASRPAAAAASAPAAAASSPVSASTRGAVLGLTATGETWITVRDASGQALVNRTLSAGQTLGVNGQTPLTVTVGRRDAIAVTVRGKPLALKPGRANVAHFTVQ